MCKPGTWAIWFTLKFLGSALRDSEAIDLSGAHECAFLTGLLTMLLQLVHSLQALQGPEIVCTIFAFSREKLSSDT